MDASRTIDGAGPIFVGGSPRSGTHIVSHLIASHSRYAFVPHEVGFHCNMLTIPGYVRGWLTKDELVERLRRWWPTFGPTYPGGLEGVIGRETFESAIAQFLAEGEEDRKSASARLIHSILDPVAAEAGKPFWVEKSVLNVMAAPILTTLLPTAKVIHVVRDGRDVACSLVSVPFGPDSHYEALARWAKRVTHADKSARRLGSDTVLTLHLEDLVHFDREATYKRLLDFLGLAEEERTRNFFSQEVTAQRAHLGRWRAELSHDEQVELTVRYEATLDELRRAGVRCIPPERVGGISHGVDSREPENPYDPFRPVLQPDRAH